MSERLRRLKPTSVGDVVRAFWQIVITGISLVAILAAVGAAGNADDAARDATRAQADQQEGRRIGQAATCAAVSAVIDSGRATIASGSAISPPQFERALEGLGLPPQRIRERQAAVAARLYAQGIASAVEEAAHVRGIVGRDGSLNCKRLRRISKIVGP
jgi:hypothetical protein